MLWLRELIDPLMTGQAPANLGPYTTMFTHGFDSAVITPACVLTGIFLLQRKPLGYLLAAPLLILCTLIGVVVIAQTISQTLAGFVFPVGVYVGMIGSWVVMGAFAIGLTVSFFRSVSDLSF
jgi:NADH:ubiquinone oxidoreductase subunit K